MESVPALMFQLKVRIVCIPACQCLWTARLLTLIKNHFKSWGGHHKFGGWRLRSRWLRSCFASVLRPEPLHAS